jgi:hypothetical protein
VPWVRFDDQYPINRKVTRLSDAAYRLHNSAIFWCARNLTDGVVPEEDLEDVCAQVRTPRKFVTEFLKRGLWHEIGAKCHSEECPSNPRNAVTDAVSDAVSNGVTGWVVHDYLEYQPSRQKVKEQREKGAARQRRFRERALTPSQQSHDNDLTEAEPGAHGKADLGEESQVRGISNGVTSPYNAVTNGASHGVSNETPSRPVPSRSSGGSPSRHLQVGDARAKPDEDEDLDKVNDQLEGRVIELLVELTGRTVDRAWASKIRRQILDGRPDVKNPLRYVSSAVRGDPTRYLPAADPGTELGAEVISAVRENDWETSAETARRRAAEARAALKGKT